MKIVTRKEAKALGLKRYFTGEPCRNGHISERGTIKSNCIECSKAYNKEYRAKTIEVRRTLERKWYDENREHVLALRKTEKYKKRKAELRKTKAYREKHNALRRTEKHRKKENENRKTEKSKRKAAAYRKTKEFKLKQFCRNSINRLAIRGYSKDSASSKILGYSKEQLKKRIESTWLEGMSWENYGEWHVDHIKPIKAFIDEGNMNPTDINALDNLQALWAADNLRKGANY
jgi:hypothetical protein